MQSELTQAMLSLHQGDHLCLFYEKDPAEQMPALIPFVQDGLARNEQCIYIADDQTVEDLGERLEQSGIDVGHESERGRLKLWTRREWRQPGELNSARKARQVRQLVDEAVHCGFEGARFAVEMTWTLGPDISAVRLAHWEATINTVFAPGFPGRIVCQYNRNRLPPEVMLAALHTHPLAIIGDHVFPNFFYQAPLILDGNANRSGSPKSQHRRNGNGRGDVQSNPAAAQVEWMVSQLERARAAENERAELIQKRATERELRASEARMRQLMSLMPAAVYTCDMEGRITFFNRHAAELWGREPNLNDEDERFCGWQQAFLPDGAFIPAAGTPMAEVLRDGKPRRNIEMIVQRRDSSRFVACVNSDPLYDREGRRSGAITVFQDVTQRYRMQEELEATQAKLRSYATDLEKQVSERTAELTETNGQLEAFVYSIAHDLRAPLRSMQAYSSMLLEEYTSQLEDTAKNYARRIVRSSESMDSMVLDLLAYGRVARAETELTTVSVQAAWAAALAQQEQAILETKARVEVTPPFPRVRAHEATLAQVLANLLSNALKFAVPGAIPQVRLWAAERPDLVRLWVEDQGIGIAPGHQERIFRVFERLNGDEYGGTGIGLSIVRKGVERMGGRVGVESTLGEGSRFWIELLKA